MVHVPTAAVHTRPETTTANNLPANTSGCRNQLPCLTLCIQMEAMRCIVFVSWSLPSCSSTAAAAFGADVQQGGAGAELWQQGVAGGSTLGAIA